MELSKQYCINLLLQSYWCAYFMQLTGPVSDNILNSFEAYINKYHYEIQETVEHYSFDLLELKYVILKLYKLR